MKIKFLSLILIKERALDYFHKMRPTKKGSASFNNFINNYDGPKGR
jgi:hypothetical protein